MYRVYYETMEGNPNSVRSGIEEMKVATLQKTKTLYYESKLTTFEDDRFAAIQTLDAINSPLGQFYEMLLFYS